MWKPGFLKKETEKKTVHQRVAETQERTVDGKFGLKPENNPIKQAETEVKMFSLGADLLTSVNNLVKSQREAVLAEAEALIGVGESPEIDDYAGIFKAITPIIQVLGPALNGYIPQIMERLGFQPPESVPLPPAPTPNPPAEPQINAKWLIETAAKTPVTALKVAMPEILKKVEEAGIGQEVFKQAIKNIKQAI